MSVARWLARAAGLAMCGLGASKIVAPAVGAAFNETTLLTVGAVEFLAGAAVLTRPRSRRAVVGAMTTVLLLVAGAVAVRHSGLPASACGCAGQLGQFRDWHHHFTLLGALVVALAPALHFCETTAPIRADGTTA